MRHRYTLYFLLFLFANCSGQSRTSTETKFTFWASSLLYVPAQEVITYYVTQDSIIVKQGAGWDFLERDKISFSSKFTRNEKAEIDSIAVALSKASFSTFYYNPCIIYGVAYEFSFNWKNQTKRTTLSNYYLDEINPFITFINKKVPQKFKMVYDKAKLETDLKNCSSTK